MSVIRFYTTQFLYFLFPCQSSDWNREWWSMSEMNVNTMYVILDRWFLFFSTCNIYLPSPTFAAHTVGYWVENPEWSNSMISCSVLRTCWKLVDQRIFCYEDKSRNLIKGELRPEIFLLHMKVLTLIKAKSNVFLWYVQCCSCTRRSKTKILTTRAPPSWIEFDVVQRQTQSASDCVMLLESITWDSQTIFLAFTRDQ